MALRMGARELFQNTSYRRLWAVGALNGIARWLEALAIGIYAFELTRSPYLVALLAMLRMAPYVALGFLVGALADRFDRRRLLMLGMLIATATAAGMAAAIQFGHGTYAAVAAVTMIGGAIWTVDMPVRRRLLVDTAGSDRVAQALGLDNATNYTMRAIGPLLGGAAYQWLGIVGIYCLVALCYATCCWLASRLERPKAPSSASGTTGGLRAALSVPRELILNRRFAVIMGVTLVYNLVCFPFTVMVPVIAQKDFLLVPLLVGALAACDGIGGTVGAVLVGAFGSERTLFRIYYLGVLALLVLMMALSVFFAVVPAVFILLLVGAAAASFSATQYALVHVISPPNVRGRATGVLSLFIGSAMIGHWIAGKLFDLFPSPAAIRIMAASGIIVMAPLGLIWLYTKAPEPRPA